MFNNSCEITCHKFTMSAIDTTEAIPGTLYRIYSDDNSKHYTTVLLENGKLLEVKNPDTKKKKTFDSLSQWCQSHNTTEDRLEIDTSPEVVQFTILNKKLAIAFNYTELKYPKKTNYVHICTKYLYSLVEKTGHKIVEADEFKTAYNQLVTICKRPEYQRNVINNTEFNYLEENYVQGTNLVYIWHQYLYSLIENATPQLVECAEFKAAYDQLVVICKKSKYQAKLVPRKQK